MERLGRIITNPIGIAIAVVHWFIVIFVFLYEGTDYLRRYLSPFKEKYKLRFFANSFGEVIVQINYFAVLVTRFLFEPVRWDFERKVFFEPLSFLVFFVLSTFQWLLIGYFITKFIESNRKLEDVKFSLKND